MSRKMSPARHSQYVARRHDEKQRTADLRTARMEKHYAQGRVS